VELQKEITRDKALYESLVRARDLGIKKQEMMANLRILFFCWCGGRNKDTGGIPNRVG